MRQLLLKDLEQIKLTLFGENDYKYYKTNIIYLRLNTLAIILNFILIFPKNVYNFYNIYDSINWGLFYTHKF